MKPRILRTGTRIFISQLDPNRVGLMRNALTCPACGRGNLGYQTECKGGEELVNIVCFDCTMVSEQARSLGSAIVLWNRIQNEVLRHA